MICAYVCICLPAYIYLWVGTEASPSAHVRLRESRCASNNKAVSTKIVYQACWSAYICMYAPAYMSYPTDACQASQISCLMHACAKYVHECVKQERDGASCSELPPTRTGSQGRERKKELGEIFYGEGKSEKHVDVLVVKMNANTRHIDDMYMLECMHVHTPAGHMCVHTVHTYPLRCSHKHTHTHTHTHMFKTPIQAFT